MDFVSLPVGGVQLLDCHYLRFSPSDLERAAQSGLFVISVLDGPFQRLVNEKGLLNVAAECARNPDEAATALHREAKDVASLIDACIDNGANAVTIADDIAYGSGMFIDKDFFSHAIVDDYDVFANRIGRGGARAIFHSCGKINTIVPAIISAGFDGLSCENECTDIASIKSRYGTSVTLFAGLSSEMLEDSPSSAEANKKKSAELISVLGVNGGLILSSSSGLYSSRMFQNIKRAYDLADSLWRRGVSPQRDSDRSY